LPYEQGISLQIGGKNPLLHVEGNVLEVPGVLPDHCFRIGRRRIDAELPLGRAPDTLAPDRLDISQISVV
jgi:hypothetical protein